MNACMCSASCKEDISQLQRVHTAEQCHLKDLVHSLQQEVARVKSDNAKLHSHCTEKASKEHMQNVSQSVCGLNAYCFCNIRKPCAGLSKVMGNMMTATIVAGYGASAQHQSLCCGAARCEGHVA